MLSVEACMSAGAPALSDHLSELYSHHKHGTLEVKTYPGFFCERCHAWSGCLLVSVLCESAG